MGNKQRRRCLLYLLLLSICSNCIQALPIDGIIDSRSALHVIALEDDASRHYLRRRRLDHASEEHDWDRNKDKHVEEAEDADPASSKSLGYYSVNTTDVGIAGIIEGENNDPSAVSVSEDASEDEVNEDKGDGNEGTSIVRTEDSDSLEGGEDEKKSAVTAEDGYVNSNEDIISEEDLDGMPEKDPSIIVSFKEAANSEEESIDKEGTEEEEEDLDEMPEKDPSIMASLKEDANSEEESRDKEGTEEEEEVGSSEEEEVVSSEEEEAGTSEEDINELGPDVTPEEEEEEATILKKKEDITNKVGTDEKEKEEEVDEEVETFVVIPENVDEGKPDVITQEDKNDDGDEDGVEEEGIVNSEEASASNDETKGEGDSSNIEGGDSEEVVVVTPKDPVIDEIIEENENGHEHNHEANTDDLTEEEVEEVARKIGGWAILLCLSSMMLTAYQMSENPDGVFASVCRLAITMTGCIIKIFLYPCKKLCGNRFNGYEHHLVTTQEFREGVWS